MAALRRVAPSEVRALMALLLVGDSTTERLGSVVLHPHQREGIARVRARLRELRGVLLADDVGLGKTYIALALASEARNPVVVAPAALRQTWRDAMSRAETTVPFVSVEALSRGYRARESHDIVVIDEAHHLRTTSTQRYAAATHLCRSSSVLLLSATPVQNSVADLRALVALFAGARADAMSEAQLAQYVIRRDATAMSMTLGLPTVLPTRWLPRADDDDCLDRLCRLPPPLPPADGSDGGILLTYVLSREWASSRAALRTALHRRVAHCLSMRDALRAGRLPSRAELRAWTLGDDAQQLAFPELMATFATPDADRLLDQVDGHERGVRELLEWLQRPPEPDDERARVLASVLDAHPGERVIAFTEFTATASALYRRLLGSARVALLTHHGGRVAGGALRRADVIAAFQAGASRRAADADRIDLLITTDVLSEGVSLQDASVVVHLDLPWNPARMEQRVGRLRRPDSARDTIAVYACPPPASVERLLRVEDRLGLKRGRMRDFAAHPAAAEQLASLLAGWRAPLLRPVACWCACVRGEMSAVLACARIDGVVKLAAVIGSALSEDASTVLGVAMCAIGDDVGNADFEAAALDVLEKLRRRATTDVLTPTELRVAQSRSAVLRRVDMIARRAPRHLRPAIARLAADARLVAGSTLSAGAERELRLLADTEDDDAAWLASIANVGNQPRQGEPELLALLVIRPD